MAIAPASQQPARASPPAPGRARARRSAEQSSSSASASSRLSTLGTTSDRPPARPARSTSASNHALPERVHPQATAAPASVPPPSDLGHQLARRCLLGGCDGVLEVDHDLVGGQGGRLGEHPLGRAWDRQAGAPGLHVRTLTPSLPPIWGNIVFTVASRRHGRLAARVPSRGDRRGGLVLPRGARRRRRRAGARQPSPAGDAARGRSVAGVGRRRQHRRVRAWRPSAASVGHIRAGRINWRLFALDGAAVRGRRARRRLPGRRDLGDAAAARDRRGAPLQRPGPAALGARRRARRDRAGARTARHPRGRVHRAW